MLTKMPVMGSQSHKEIRQMQYSSLSINLTDAELEFTWWTLRIFTEATFNAMSGLSWLICQRSWTKVEPNAAANQNTLDAFPKHMRRKRSESRCTLVAWPVKVVV